MERIVLLTLCFLVVLVSCNAQFSLPFDSNECALGKLLDPLLAETLKSKYPKKYGSKLGFRKDVALNAKYRMGAEKLLARHLKNLHAVNQDIQKMWYQQPQFAMQPLTVSNQASLSPQLKYLTNLQNHFDARRRFTICPSVNAQMSALSQVTDHPFQQPTYQLPGVQSVTYFHPQQASYKTAFTLPM